ncbi:hypothetical protein V8E54_006559 [Elaphomyces granulatus]
MLDANTSSGPDHERPGLEKETSEPPHGKLEKADPGPVSACTANIGDRKSSPSREGRPTTREDGRGRDFQSDRVKSMRRQSLLSVALENPFERLPLQPFPSYAANGKFLLHSRPSPPICLLLTCISQSAQSLHCPFLQNPRQAFLKSLLPPIHIPLDMIGIKAMITQQGATRDNRPSQERLPPRPFPSYATNETTAPTESLPLPDMRSGSYFFYANPYLSTTAYPFLQNGFFEITAPTESLAAGHAYLGTYLAPALSFSSRPNHQPKALSFTWHPLAPALTTTTASAPLCQIQPFQILTKKHFTYTIARPGLSLNRAPSLTYIRIPVAR